MVAPSTQAAVTVRHTATHRTKRSVSHVLSVLKAHDKTCDSGCKYRAPDVARSVVLRHRHTPKLYYIWIHVEAVKDSRSFQRISIVGSGDKVVFNVQMPSRSEIEDLERHTSYEHDTLLDGLRVTITLTRTAGVTSIRYDAEASASGMFGMFEGVIKKSLKANGEAIFANVDK